jgi:hypothetical protein
MSEEDAKSIGSASCSGIVRCPSEEELSVTRKEITDAMRYIKPYRGPSRTWFDYQNSLREGCARLSAIVSKLPAHQLTAALLANILVRLHRKLTVGGVDDSDGTAGEFIGETLSVLQEYARLDPSCGKELEKAENLRF